MMLGKAECCQLVKSVVVPQWQYVLSYPLLSEQSAQEKEAFQ